MIPTRTQLQDKINEIRQAPGFSTLKEEIYTGVSQWLTDEGCPATDKEKILSDLDSYEGY